MELDLKTVGQISMRIADAFPETIVSIRKAKDFDGLEVPEEAKEHYIVNFEEPDTDKVGYDVTNIAEVLNGDIENIILTIISIYGDDVPTTPSGRTKLGELLSKDFNAIKDRLRVTVISEDSNEQVKEETLTEKLEGTNLYKMLILDIEDFCKSQTLPSKKIMIVPKTLSDSWEVSDEEIMEIAAENTGNKAYATDISYEFDQTFTEDEKGEIKEYLGNRKNIEEAKIQSDRSEWNNFTDEWITEEKDDSVQEEAPLNLDNEEIGIRMLELHSGNGGFGVSVMADDRFMTDLCNKEFVQAGFILPFYEHKCLFIPDKGFDGNLLKENFLKDLYEMMAEDEDMIPFGQNIYKYSISSGLEAI